jgi:hypothetical protein
MELLVLSEVQAELPLALTELREAASVIMEEVVPHRVHTELQEALGMDSGAVKMVSAMEAVVPLPARMGHLLEASMALVTMEEVPLVVTEVGLLPALMELQVDLKAELGAMVAAEHLPVLMVPLVECRMVLVVDLMEAESEVDLKLGSDVMEEAEYLPALMELLAEVKVVSEVDLTEVVLRPVRMELQVDLKMDSDVMEAAEHLPVFMALLAVARAVLVDLL